MARLVGISYEMFERITGEMKVVSAANAGVLFRLSSQSDYVRLASNEATHILYMDVTAAGVTTADILQGAPEIVATKVNDYAWLIPLRVGDLFRTGALASGSDLGAISGAYGPSSPLGIDQATGKLRSAQATDTIVARLSPEGGNQFNTDGTIWVHWIRAGKAALGE